MENIYNVKDLHGDFVLNHNQGPSKKSKSRDEQESTSESFWDELLNNEYDKTLHKYSPLKNRVICSAPALKPRPAMGSDNSKIKAFIDTLKTNAQEELKGNIEDTANVKEHLHESRFVKKIFSVMLNVNKKLPPMAYSEAVFNQSLLHPCLYRSATVFIIPSKANMPLISFDNIKGMFALLGMMKTVADRYSYASVESFQKLKLYYIQASDEYLRLWSIKYVSNGIYAFDRVDKMSIHEDSNKLDSMLSPLLDFFYQVKNCLVKTCTVLKELKAEDEENSSEDSSSQREVLSDIICPQVFRLSYNKDEKGFAKLAYCSPEYDL